MPSAIEQPEFHIPTVDISAYLADPLSAEAQHVVGAVRLACTTSGFFQLVGHGIQPAVRNAMFSGAKALFKLSFAEKKALKRAGNRGYEVMGSQALQDGTLPDLKEVPAAPSLFACHTSSDVKRGITSAKTASPLTRAGPTVRSWSPTSGRQRTSFHPPFSRTP